MSEDRQTTTEPPTTAKPSNTEIERLIERSTSPDPGFDVKVALRIDELAWSSL